MNRRKGFIAVVLGVLCAFVLGACGVLGIDVSEKVKTPEQSGSLELENEEKAAYATAGQLK